jgi:hypothetical protein
MPSCTLDEAQRCDVRVRTCSHFVLNFCCNLSYIVVHPGPTGARSRGVASVGRRAVPPQVSHPCDRGRSTLAMPGGPPKRTARDEQLGSHLHQHRSSRAARHASLDCSSGLRLHSLRPEGAGSLTRQQHPFRHGRPCCRPPSSSAATKVWIPGTRPGMTAEGVIPDRLRRPR